jgi:hypothetical protein
MDERGSMADNEKDDVVQFIYCYFFPYLPINDNNEMIKYRGTGTLFIFYQCGMLLSSLSAHMITNFTRSFRYYYYYLTVNG